MTPDEIVAQLGDMGISLESRCVNPGNYETQSTWVATLAAERFNTASDFEFHQGCAHRRWKTMKNDPTRLTKVTASALRRAGFKMGELPPPYKNWGTRATLFMFDLWDKHTEPTPPTLDNVLYCLTMDAASVRHGQTFEEWCANYGSDTDSIKALEAFNSCTESWRKLCRLGLDFDQLDTMFQDY